MSSTYVDLEMDSAFWEDVHVSHLQGFCVQHTFVAHKSRVNGAFQHVQCLRTQRMGMGRNNSPGTEVQSDVGDAECVESWVLEHSCKRCGGLYTGGRDIRCSIHHQMAQFSKIWDMSVKFSVVLECDRYIMSWTSI